MGSFGDLLYDLSTALGSGMSKGMEEQRTEAREIKKARRTAELNKEYQVQTEQRAQAGQIEDEARAEVAAGKKRRGVAAAVGPYLGEALSTEAPASTSDVQRGRRKPYVLDPETPLEGISHLMGIAEKREAREAKEPKAPTMTQIKLGAGTPGDPNQARYQGVLDAEEKRKRDLFEYNLGTKPFEAQERKNIETVQHMQRTLAVGIGSTVAPPGTLSEAQERANKYLGSWKGPTASLRESWNQAAGGTLMSAEESEFRAAITDIVARLGNLLSGQAISEAEYQRLKKIAPNLSTAPENFVAALNRFNQELADSMKAQKRLALESRRSAAAKEASPDPSFTALED
jgi:hypothetical protein